MEETWVSIPEFSIYAISNYGNIINESTGRLMQQSRTQSGILKVGLIRGGQQHTRSVKLLVADAFVDGRDHIFDTPVQLDNNRDNIRADNLVWRPRWFAHEYTNQFKFPSENDHIGPLIETSSGDWYKDVYEVGTTHGFLFRDIRLSLSTNNTVFPSLMRFELV